MKLIRHLIIFLMILIFLLGLGVLLYPYVRGYLVDHRIEQEAREFLSWVEIPPFVPDPSESTVVIDAPTGPTEPTEPDTYVELWRDMIAYNEKLYDSGQKDLNCKLAYETPNFHLSDYGLEDEIFAVISIPKLDLQMPIYLGASYQHMADGAALLSQTSIPIGGNDTNCIIAGHRGWKGASYFRYITDLEIGDTITITNLWEELTYQVCEIQIIEPYQVEQIFIRSGRELVTLLTCHPYASGGRQRYLVICERIENEPDIEITQ